MVALWVAAAAAAPAVQPAQREEARRAFAAGEKEFAAANYRRALRLYRQAYRLMPLPGFHFNIGQCYRNLKEYDGAIASFDAYLKALPAAPNRAAVEQLLRKLIAERAAARRAGEDLSTGPRDGGSLSSPPTDAGVASVPTDQGAAFNFRDAKAPTRPRDGGAPAPFYRKWWFWTAVGLAVAGGAAGIYAGVSSGGGLPDTRFVADFRR